MDNNLLSDIKRPAKYLYCTWLSAIMAGEIACNYRVWKQINYKLLDKKESDDPSFLANYMKEHSEFLNYEFQKLIDANVNTKKEFEIKAWLPGKILISGKVDLLVEMNDQFIVIDTKSGKAKASHPVQIQLYMYLLSKNKLYKHLKPRGIVRYKNNDIKIDKIPDDFEKKFNTWLDILGREDAKASPSYSECRFCPITKASCQWRIDEDLNTTDDYDFSE